MTKYYKDHPLSKDFSNVNCKEIQKNLQGADSETISAFIEYNIRLVFRIVSSKFYDTQFEHEDLISVGSIGLMKAVKTFDINKNFQFSTYASVCITNEILLFLRQGKYGASDVSLDTTYNGDTLESILEDQSDSIEDTYVKKTILLDISNIINNLDYKKKIIFLMYFGLNNYKKYTQKEIAEIFNIRQATVSRTIKSILNEIRSNLCNQGYTDIPTKLCRKK